LNATLPHSGVAVEWARRKIDELVEQHQQSHEEEKAVLREQTLAIALKYHQVSPFTSLVAVDQEPVRAGGELHTQRIPANAPKGSVSTVPFTGQGIRLAQTATDNRFSLLSGALFLALAVVLRVAGNALRRPTA
jgi:Ca-activated chloride channel family protein